MITVSLTFAADNTDCLNGTDLENIPEDGALDIYMASTQADTEVTLTAPGGDTPIRKQTLQLRTNAVISLSDDVPISVPVNKGKFIVDLNIVTGATVRMIAIFRTEEEALADMGLFEED